MHRPGDASFADKKLVDRIVDSGGVGAHQFDEPKYSRRQGEQGIAPSVKAIIAHDLNVDERLRAISGRVKGAVSWYYLNLFSQQNIVTYASEGELVFRVPMDWLRLNALSCVEKHVGNNESYARQRPFWAWAFLTDLVVPLEYRIVQNVELQNEKLRAMSNPEVAQFVFNAHVQYDESSRRMRFNPPPPEWDPDEPVPHINPF